MLVLSDGLSTATDPIKAALTAAPPPSTGDLRFDAAIAGIVEHPLVRDHGVRPSYPVRVYPWGTVELVLTDPDGFVVVVIAHATEPEVAALRRVLPIEIHGDTET